MRFYVKMKKFIAVGKSPVKGVGRFDAYAAQRLGTQKGDAKSKYPWPQRKGKYPGKKIRPINLHLSGKFLKQLTHWVVSKNKISFGFNSPDEKTKKLIETHNEGKHPDVPMRRFLPTRKGEDLVVSVKRKTLETLQLEVNKVVQKSNRSQK